MSPRILVTGAGGIIGLELVRHLRERSSAYTVIATDIRSSVSEALGEPFRLVDVVDLHQMERVVKEERIDWLIHLAAVLSSDGEKELPRHLLDVNARGVENALEVARRYGLRVFIPSSIAAEDAPGTLYGICKVYAEMLGEYYFRRFGVDFRSIRYPGIVSAGVVPTGGKETA